MPKPPPLAASWNSVLAPDGAGVAAGGGQLPAALPLKWARFFTVDAVQQRLWSELPGRLASRPPDLSPRFLTKTAWRWATIETMSMSGAGHLCWRWWPGWRCRCRRRDASAGRAASAAISAQLQLKSSCASIPELVWASILLIAAGLGPFAGTLALAARTPPACWGACSPTAVENAAPLPEQSLRTNGASAIASALYFFLRYLAAKTLPQMLSSIPCTAGRTISAPPPSSAWWAPAVWDKCSNITLSLFQMQKAATRRIIASMLLLVALVDAASYAARRLMSR